MLESDTQLLVYAIAGWVSMLVLIILAVRDNPWEAEKILVEAMERIADEEKKDRVMRNPGNLLKIGFAALIAYVAATVTLTELVNAYRNIDRNILLFSAVCGWLSIIILVVMAVRDRRKRI